MAVITISRQVAALGDEVAGELAKRLGYKFITRKEIEKRIVELGFPENKMPKFDERKPGFFASLTKDRDEYLNYAQYATLSACRIVSSSPIKTTHSISMSAAAVAVATPCCPAPVSAISLVFPIFLARSA